MINKSISEVIQSRRSIYPKDFNGKIIPQEVIMELLENANYAPTHKMTQPWMFKIFFKESKIKLLEEIINKNSELSENKKNKMEENFKKSSHIICVCMKSHGHLLPEWEEVASTAMAVQNLWLTCVNTNIGGYWSTPKYLDKLTSFLGLSKDEKCLGFFYLGCHESEQLKERKRHSIHDKIEWFK